MVAEETERREQMSETCCQMGNRSRKGKDTHAHLLTGSEDTVSLQAAGS